MGRLYDLSRDKKRAGRELSLLGLALHAAVAALRRVLVPWHVSVQRDLVRFSG